MPAECTTGWGQAQVSDTQRPRAAWPSGGCSAQRDRLRWGHGEQTPDGRRSALACGSQRGRGSRGRRGLCWEGRRQARQGAVQTLTTSVQNTKGISVQLTKINISFEERGRTSLP